MRYILLIISILTFSCQGALDLGTESALENEPEQEDEVITPSTNNAPVADVGPDPEPDMGAMADLDEAGRG